MKHLNWIAWTVIAMLAVLIIIQQRTINDYKIVTQAYECAIEEYKETVDELYGCIAKDDSLIFIKSVRYIISSDANKTSGNLNWMNLENTR